MEELYGSSNFFGASKDVDNMYAGEVDRAKWLPEKICHDEDGIHCVHEEDLNVVSGASLDLTQVPFQILLRK